LRAIVAAYDIHHRNFAAIVVKAFDHLDNSPGDLGEIENLTPGAFSGTAPDTTCRFPQGVK
jgi:hypothetical protein